MSGVIEVEGAGRVPYHPNIGEIRTEAKLRRALKDFPPLAWFTSEVAVPNCLRNTQFSFVDNKTGEVKHDERAGKEVSDALALNRVAIGFRLADVPSIMPWPEYAGFSTAEGRELNESAQEMGDDPTKWFVSETPVDLLKSIQFWSSVSILKPYLERRDAYLKDMHNMVRNCRERDGIYIPPSWLKPDQARALVARFGVPVFDGDQKLPEQIG
ncbi:hypothetical protein CK489_15515 [Bradyrhizobium sp. UFLA03-84]|nr:hypothetical protein CK489_15515 [Bradyrhizobium sp. UFLA03-84]